MVLIVEHKPPRVCVLRAVCNMLETRIYCRCGYNVHSIVCVNGFPCRCPECGLSLRDRNDLFHRPKLAVSKIVLCLTVIASGPLLFVASGALGQGAFGEPDNIWGTIAFAAALIAVGASPFPAMLLIAWFRIRFSWQKLVLLSVWIIILSVILGFSGCLVKQHLLYGLHQQKARRVAAAPLIFP